ncbi:MAG: alpha-E domain-containing protein, partial [Burkholderiales bacterium]
MLSRSANDLFWMSRHVERAENIARMLDVTYRVSLLPYRVADACEKWAEPWALPLVITGLATKYYEQNEVLSPERVIHFMVSDATNPASIHSLLQSARENARGQRGAITSEMWESINATWLEIRGLTYDAVLSRGVSELFDWVKTRSHLFRGVTVGTMGRDEGYHFTRLGTHLERADNTARILDV